MVETKQKLWVVVPNYVPGTPRPPTMHICMSSRFATPDLLRASVSTGTLNFRLSLAICHTCLHQVLPISEQSQSSYREGVLPRRQQYKHTKLLQTRSTTSGRDPNDVLRVSCPIMAFYKSNILLKAMTLSILPKLGGFILCLTTLHVLTSL